MLFVAWWYYYQLVVLKLSWFFHVAGAAITRHQTVVRVVLGFESPEWWGADLSLVTFPVCTPVVQEMKTQEKDRL